MSKDTLAETRMMIRDALDHRIGEHELTWPVELTFPSGSGLVSARVHQNGDAELVLEKPIEFIEMTFHVDTRVAEEAELAKGKP